MVDDKDEHENDNGEHDVVSIEKTYDLGQWTEGDQQLIYHQMDCCKCIK